MFQIVSAETRLETNRTANTTNPRNIRKWFVSEKWSLWYIVPAKALWRTKFGFKTAPMNGMMEAIPAISIMPEKTPRKESKIR